MKSKKKIALITLACLFTLTCVTAFAGGGGQTSGPGASRIGAGNNPHNGPIKTRKETGSVPSTGSTSNRSISDTATRGKNAYNSNAGFTAADGNGDNALVFRMGLAQLTAEEVNCGSTIDEKAEAVQDYGSRHYVATQGASYVYGAGANLATEDYRGNPCTPAPSDSLAYQVMHGIDTGTEVKGLLLKRDDGSMYIDPTTSNIDTLMSELASLDGINQGLYQMWQSELTSGSASTHPVVIVIEVCGVVVGDGANYFAAPSDMCLRIGGQTAYEALLTTDLNAYGGTVTSLTDKAIASLCGYDSGTNDYDTWPYRWTKRFFATTWKPGTIKFLPSSGTRSKWAWTAWQTLSYGHPLNANEKGINGCTIVTIGGAGITGYPEGYFDWHINAQYATPNSAGYCEDQIVYTSEIPTYQNEVYKLCIAQENYAQWESWFNNLGVPEAKLKIKTYHLGQESFTTNVEKIKSSGTVREGAGIASTTGAFTQEITLSDTEFFEALEDETITFAVATDQLGPNLNANGMLSVAYAMDVTVEVGTESVQLKNDSCHWIVYSTGDKKTYTFQQIIDGPYAQIKQGGLDKEKYEAMAGTPTTEDLFVSMGGNQYVVNMQFRYCEDDYKRTYHCYTKEVPNYTYYKMSPTTVSGEASASETASGSTVEAMNTSNALILTNYNTAKTTKLTEARTAIKNALSGINIDTNSDTYTYTTCKTSGSAIKDAFNSWIDSASTDAAESSEVTLFAGQDPETGEKFCIKAKLTLTVVDTFTDGGTVAEEKDTSGNVTGISGADKYEVSYTFTMSLAYYENETLSQECLSSDKKLERETDIVQTFENVKYMDIIEAQVWQLAKGREVGIGAIICQPISSESAILEAAVKQLGYVFYDSDSACTHTYNDNMLWRCMSADDLENTGRLVNSFNEGTVGAVGSYINNDTHAFKIVEWGDTVELEYDPAEQGGRSHRSINTFFAQAAAHSFYEGSASKPRTNTILCTSDVLALQTEKDWITFTAFEFDTKNYVNDADTLKQYILQPDYTNVTQFVSTVYSKDGKNAPVNKTALFTASAAYNSGKIPLNDSTTYGAWTKDTICETDNTFTFADKNTDGTQAYAYAIPEEHGMPYVGYRGDYQTSTGSHTTLNDSYNQGFDPSSSVSIWNNGMDVYRPGVTGLAKFCINISAGGSGDKEFPYKDGLNVNRTQPNNQYKTGYASLLYEHIIDKTLSEEIAKQGVATVQIYSNGYSTVKKPSLKDLSKYPEGMFLNAVYGPGYTTVNDVIIFNPTTAEQSGVVKLSDYLPDAQNTDGSDSDQHPLRDQRVGTSATTMYQYETVDTQMIVPSLLDTSYIGLEDYEIKDWETPSEVAENTLQTVTRSLSHKLTLYDSGLNAMTVLTPLKIGDQLYMSDSTVYRKGKTWQLTTGDLVNGIGFDGSKLTYPIDPDAWFEVAGGDEITITLPSSLMMGDVLHMHIEPSTWVGELDTPPATITAGGCPLNSFTSVDEGTLAIDTYFEVTDNRQVKSEITIMFTKDMVFDMTRGFTFLKFEDTFLFSTGSSSVAVAQPCGTIDRDINLGTANAYATIKAYNPYCTDVLSASDVGDIRSAANTLYISYRKDSRSVAQLKTQAPNPHKVPNCNWRYHVLGMKTTAGNTIYAPNDPLLYEDSVRIILNSSSGTSFSVEELRKTACIVAIPSASASGDLYTGYNLKITTIDGVKSHRVEQDNRDNQTFAKFSLSASPEKEYTGAYPLKARQKQLFDEYEYAFLLEDTDGPLYDVKSATNPRFKFASDDDSSSIVDGKPNWEYDWKKVTIAHNANEKLATESGDVISTGTFISLDDAFDVYYKNIGDFHESDAHNIATPSSKLGYGFTDGMRTTKWLKEKYVVFDMDVWMFDEYDPTVPYTPGQGDLYFVAAGTKIPLGYYDGDEGEHDNEGKFIDYADSDDLKYDTDPDKYNRDGGTYHFWCALSSSEAMGAEVKFVAKNINGPTDGNETPTNKNVPSPPFRYTDAKRTVAVDIVGRIGALTMIDTGDYRLSNTFKSTSSNADWLVHGLVRKLSPYSNISRTPSTQRKIVTDPFDVRGRLGLSNMIGRGTPGYKTYLTTDSLNTYGTQWHKVVSELKSNRSTLSYTTDPIVSLPLTSAYNDTSALKMVEQKLGYKNYMTLESIGTYHGGDSMLFDKLDENKENLDAETPVNLNGDYNNNKIQIRPVYIAIKLSDSGVVESYPVDVYMKTGNTYTIINSAAKDNKVVASVMNKNPYYYYMTNNTATNGLDQNMKRRMVTEEEATITNRIIDLWNYFDSTTVYKSLLTNFANSDDLTADVSPTYTYGTGQYLFLRARNRTFVGKTSQALNGADIADGKPYNLSQQAYNYAELNYNAHAQKWYFDLGLPSSAQFVKSGTPFSIDAVIKDKNTYILQAVDIYAVGDVWTLHYQSPVSTYNVNINGHSIGPSEWNPISDSYKWLIPVTVYNSGDTTAAIDLSTGGSH